MKRLCIVLACLAIPLQLGASAQSQAPRLAYDFCGPVATDNGLEIWCEVRLSSGDPNPVSATWALHPAWSADGLRIAVSNFDLTIYNLADGSTTVFPGTGWVDEPRWSPDNARIAFTSYRDNQAELYVINADGSALTRLTDNVGFRGGYAWSPDGTAIAFGATVGGVPEIFVMQRDGSNKTRLTYNVGVDTNPATYPQSAPSWSSDGARIAFDCGNDICSINADGTNLTHVTTDPAWASGGVFSPVDGRLAFTTGRFGGNELAILEENGAVTRVAAGLDTMQHAWSPGGESLAFVNAVPFDCYNADNSCTPGQLDMVYTINSDGSALTQVGQGHHPQWAPSMPGQPVASFTYTCSGAACQFDASGSFDADGSITSYAWDFGDGTTGTGTTAAHQYVTGGNYPIKLTVTDNTGAIDISLRNITANAPPVASFTMTCNGPTCTFNGTASDPDGTVAWYTWIFGDGSYYPATGATVTYVYPSGTFLAKLQVVDNGGSVGTATAAATVTIVNAPPAAAFTVSCAGLRCTFDASTSTDDDTIQTYYWEFGDGHFTWAKAWTYTYQAGGTYVPRLTVIDTVNQSTTTTRTVTVALPPPPPPPLEMHVGNLTAASTSAQKAWNALVTIQMHRDTHQVIGGVTVSGTWSDGSTATCQTDATGRCAMSRTGIPNKANSLTLTVTGAALATYVYKPAMNHDPDGGSNGTSIVVQRR